MSNHWLGYAGTTLVILAYLPQIFHLVKEHCSAGLCVKAYLMWVAASVLLLSYAVSQRDAVFVALQGYQLVSTTLICFFSKKYEHNLCEDHGGESFQRLGVNEGPETSNRTTSRLRPVTAT
ncbi:MAG: hypothetical protein GTO40_04895 [Deltaproteobacteria bacterium]|nr:hypothetical protein [Deltaproteobacteria bacterium]